MSREPHVEVELVEGAPADPPGPAPDAGAEGVDAAGGTRPRAGRRPSWLRPRTLVAGVLVVAAGLAGTQAMLDARERAAYARFADVPGVVAPLSPDLGVLWRPDAEQTDVLWSGLQDAGGLSVGARFDEAGAPSAVALDPRTGDVAWSVPLGDADPVLAETLILPRVPCDVSDDGLLACLVGSAYGPATPGEGSVEGGEPAPVPGRAELVVLDASDGAVVRRAPEEVGTTLHALGDLVVTARVEPDASIAVRALDARSGDEAWTHTTPPGTATPSDAEVGGDVAPFVTPVGDGVLVHAGDGGVRLAADGTVEATYAPGTDGDEDAALTVARGHVLRQSDSAGAAELLADDGTGGAMPPGFPHQLSVDDGTEPDLLLLPSRSGNGLDGWDARTSRLRWSRPDVPYSDAAMLDGTLYVANAGGAVALDPADGTTRWTSEAPPAGSSLAVSSTASLLTDGRVLGVVGQRVSGPPVVLAFTLSDGRLAWTAELPGDVQNVLVAGRVVIGWGHGAPEPAVLG
ncbi:PQQ-binding-like beta-propeller repeat protein [Cellulomonas cellasea]|uniref:Outer membrane protein assembly factor BamB n=1 Tax=Cellulomonas cellasea TaxID=43670 RepID=A0A7W4UJK2_9CELL|nr:PQQ-binding-like beta-propeller repeat protein [Cellulomonas cellasea]MBB2925302.1 outer membrane protein assembly factor BamB [Cellulomonas cellasea]